MLFQVFPKYCRQHLDPFLFLVDSIQDVYDFGHRNSNAYEKLFDYLLYKQNLFPIVNICREFSATSYE